MFKWKRRQDDGVFSAGTRRSEDSRGFIDVQTFGALSALVITLLATMYLLTITAATNLIYGIDKHATSATSTIPEYLQTRPQMYAGPTATAQMAPFLAQVNPAPFGDPNLFVANAPLETAVPIAGNANNDSIFQSMGHLSPYSASPGFGSNEYPLPPGTNISQVHVLHRHGARYPTGDSSVGAFGTKIHNLTDTHTARWSGPLSFLQSWRYTLGDEILVARGRQELFDSGVLHYYNYGRLYNTSTKIIARTTTQDRMLKSAEYFMAGFFGLEWTTNVTLEVQIEQDDFNTSLAGYFKCPNSNNFRSSGGSNASATWERTYLAGATERLRKFSGDYDWTTADSYHAQTLCPYETVAYGYSQWCELFTYEEWQAFEYSIDLQFYGNAGFGAPTGRGVGIGFVQELYARLQNHLYDLVPGATNVNYTLDTMNSTFPLDQTIYFDFSHDTNMFSILTALGLHQFADALPTNSMPSNRSVVISHITPFGARFDFEIIQAPQPVKAVRPTSRNATLVEYYENGNARTYIHLLINQRTIPLYRSYPECGQRDDGWCDIDIFMKQLDTTLDTARYQYSCFGDYAAAPPGQVTNGVPIT